MNRIAIKSYKLKEFSTDVRNSKVDEIKRTFINHSGNWIETFETLVKEIRLIYGLSQGLETFKLYWKDEDDELVSLSNYQELKTAHDVSNGGTVKIYFVENNNQKYIEETIDFEIKIDKNIQKHPNVICDGCKGDILGIRYVCTKCDNYDLCENCKTKGIHQEHLPFANVESIFGFDMCIECGTEITTNLNVCKNCTTEKLPEINKGISKRNLKYTTYLVCDDCKTKNHEHKNHSFLITFIKDLIKSNRRLTNEIKIKRSKGEEINFFSFVTCAGCRRNGASLKSISYGSENVNICVDCLIEGAFVNLYTFNWLTNEDADYIRDQLHHLKQIQAELRQTQMKSAQDQNDWLKITALNFNRTNFF